MSQPVFITGTGIVSPAGLGARTAFESLLAGGRHVAWAADADLAAGEPVPAGRVPGLPCLDPDLDPVCHLSDIAADEAAADAGLHDHPVDPERLAVSFGTSKGGILAFSRAAECLRHKPQRRDLRAPLESSLSLSRTLLRSTLHDPLLDSICSTKAPYASLKKSLVSLRRPSFDLLTLLCSIPPDAPARRIARRLGAGAGTHATVAACSTGSLAVIRGVQMIRDGRADVVIAGSGDASIHPLWIATFRRLGVLAGPEPARGAAWACRPFDRSRAGFAIAEGAGALVLESADSVRRRGAKPLARITGVATGSDPAGLAMLSPDGMPLARAIQAACRDADCHPARLAAIQAHGTGTPANDQAETRAIRLAGCLENSLPPMVSIKGSLGHMLGAAGAVELAICAEAARARALPPNPTLIEPDPDLGRLCLLTRPAVLRPGPILKTSLGFGGHVAALIVEPA